VEVSDGTLKRHGQRRHAEQRPLHRRADRPEMSVSSPRLAPWLMPDRTSAASEARSPSKATRTQSTGEPSQAKSGTPSSSPRHSTETARLNVAARAQPLRLPSGATTIGASPAFRSASATAMRPSASMPSSLVTRIRKRSSITHRLPDCGRARHDEPTRTYLERRQSEGKTPREAMPSLAPGSDRTLV
jgi:hypothetical protein